VVTAFAQSTLQSQNNGNGSSDPQPGYTYYVVYSQTDGSIVAAVGCPSSPASCTPILQPGQSVVYITDQPALVKQLFDDAHNAKLGNWHVTLQTHQLAGTSATSSASIAPPGGISLIGAILPTLASLGVGTSGTLIWRRTQKQA
jgi:hypothetical protein